MVEREPASASNEGRQPPHRKLNRTQRRALGKDGWRRRVNLSVLATAMLLAGALAGAFIDADHALSRLCEIVTLCKADAIAEEQPAWPDVLFEEPTRDMEHCGIFAARVRVFGDPSGLEFFIGIVDNSSDKLFMGTRPRPDAMPAESEVGAWYRQGEYTPVFIMVRRKAADIIDELAKASENPPLFGIELPRGDNVQFFYSEVTVTSTCPLPLDIAPAAK